MKEAASKALDFVLVLVTGGALALIIACAAIGACVVAVVSLFSAMLYGGGKQ